MESVAAGQGRPPYVARSHHLPPMSRSASLLRALALAAALAGCQTAPSTPPEPVPAEAPVAPAPPETPAALLSIDTEGLRIVDATSGSTTALAFGSDMTQAVEAVTRLRGAVGERGVNGECGAGPLDIASWPDGLSLLASDGKLAGWSLAGVSTPVAVPVTTMNGIGIGTTRADLTASGSEVTVEESTLGTEFAAGDLYGLLSGPEASATVTNLWSGVSCNFR